MVEIIIRMPIRKEIKNEISYLQNKVKAFAQKYNLLIVQEEIWSGEKYW